MGNGLVILIYVRPVMLEELAFKKENAHASSSDVDKIKYVTRVIVKTQFSLNAMIEFFALQDMFVITTTVLIDVT